MTRHTAIISSMSTSSPPRRRSAWIGAVLLAGVLAGSIPGRAGAQCASGDLLAMTDPVVTVIAGPGDVVAEQALWSSLEVGWLDGSFEISLGETFSYEAAP
jgi:hypothetical protein